MSTLSAICRGIKNRAETILLISGDGEELEVEAQLLQDHAEYFRSKILEDGGK
jgi:hypothetical protein